jgi:dihydroxyacetone kinase
LKLCGSASEAGYDFDTCFNIGQAVNDNCVTVGSSLDHCHIPGREHHRHIPDSAVVLGMGIHNEAGLHEIDPMPTVDELITNMLKYCLDPNDKDRAFVDFNADDTVLLLVNNFGGLSNLELEALTASTRRLLKKEWSITPQRCYVSAFETSLNAPGFSFSLLNVSGIERKTGTSVKDLLKLLDAETTAPAWPRNGYRELKETYDATTGDADAKAASNADEGPDVDSTRLERAIRSACSAAIAAEPEITKWDIEMGDGDCGEAVVGMCQGVLRKLDAGLCKSGKIFHILDEIDEAVEEIGGTLGAIIAIIVAAFATNLRQALRNLMGYTSARMGGRTVMDTLIPFCETFAKSGIDEAVQAAEEGAKSTGGMKAKFGRATYVGEKADAGEAPPDPGAMAAFIFLQGFKQGY